MQSGGQGQEEVWREMTCSGNFAGYRVHYEQSVDSTNTLALALCDAAAGQKIMVVAESQTQGRGRLGRIWLSPPGTGLYLSLVVYPKLSPADFPKITLAAGLALCLALEQVGQVTPRLKWPNDLLVGGRKCGGILTETTPFRPGAATAVVVGIGLNVNTPAQAFPPELAGKVTSLLHETGRRYDRGALLLAIIGSLEGQLAILEEGGFAKILGQWRERDAYRDQAVSWVTERGQVVRGISLGPDASGMLQVRDGQGNIHTVISGDISLAAS